MIICKESPLNIWQKWLPTTLPVKGPNLSRENSWYDYALKAIYQDRRLHVNREDVSTKRSKKPTLKTQVMKRNCLWNCYLCFNTVTVTGPGVHSDENQRTPINMINIRMEDARNTFTTLKVKQNRHGIWLRKLSSIFNAHKVVYHHQTPGIYQCVL